jgi:hypothetical protein
LQFSDTGDCARVPAPAGISAALGYPPSAPPASVARFEEGRKAGRTPAGWRATLKRSFEGMTDHPRFEPVRRAPETAHLDYNGGRLVEAVFRLLDRWQGARAAAARAGAKTSPCGRHEDARKSAAARSARADPGSRFQAAAER